MHMKTGQCIFCSLKTTVKLQSYRLILKIDKSEKYEKGMLGSSPQQFVKKKFEFFTLIL